MGFKGVYASWTCFPDDNTASCKINSDNHLKFPVSKPVIASTSESQLSGSCLDSLDVELRKMIQQVIDVLPQVPVSAVKKDLGSIALSNMRGSRNFHERGSNENGNF